MLATGFYPEHADRPHHSGQGQHAAERARRRGGELDPQLMGAGLDGCLDETGTACSVRSAAAVSTLRANRKVEAPDADAVVADRSSRRRSPAGWRPSDGRGRSAATRRGRSDRAAGGERLGQIGWRIGIGDPRGQILVGAGGRTRAPVNS